MIGAGWPLPPVTDHRVSQLLRPPRRRARPIRISAFSGGGVTSSIGTWMQSVAQSWLVLTLTGFGVLPRDRPPSSPVPGHVLALLGGVVATGTTAGASCWSRRRSSWCPRSRWRSSWRSCRPHLAHPRAVVMTGTPRPSGTGVPVAAAVAGGPKDLPAASRSTRCSSTWRASSGRSPPVSRWRPFGSAACFGLNGVSYLAVVVALLMVRLRGAVLPRPVRSGRNSPKGFAYVRHEPSLISYMVLAFVTHLARDVGADALALLVKQVFGGGAGDYSRMMAFSGAGAVVGALASAVARRYRPDGTHGARVLGRSRPDCRFALSRVA